MKEKAVLTWFEWRNSRAKSEIVENSFEEAYSRIPEGLVLFFPILQSTTLFFVEAYLDMDKHERKSSFNLLWVKEFILEQNPKEAFSRIP